jgi:c-di-GMP-binding flagellar brake protein YcgR
MDKVSGDRRRTKRYEIRLPLHYRLSIKGEPSRSGSGMTIDMSTTGMSFRSRKPLPVGAHVEVVVDWPAKYSDVYPIDLQVTGFVVRSDSGRSAVRMTSRKFRVATMPAEPIRATA